MKHSFQYNVLITLCLLYVKLDSCDGILYLYLRIIMYIVSKWAQECLMSQLNSTIYSNLGVPFHLVGMENQRNCSSLADYEDIDNVHDCKKFASEAGHSFKGTKWSKYYPIGCYWFDRGNKMVYYNYHLTGGFQSDAIPVCINTKKGKSTYEKCMVLNTTKSMDILFYFSLFYVIAIFQKPRLKALQSVKRLLLSRNE